MGWVRLDLRLRTRTWGLFTALFAGIGVPFAVASVALFIDAVVRWHAGPLVGALFLGLAGAVLTPAAVASWRLYQAHPTLVVDQEGLTIEHSGLFREPLRLDRSAVEALYLGAFSGHEHAPAFEGRAPQRLWQYRRWLDRRGVTLSLLPVDGLVAPDLSILYDADDRNLLIVPITALPLKGVARRGLGMLRVAMGFVGYTGPTRATIVRGRGESSPVVMAEPHAQSGALGVALPALVARHAWLRSI